MNEDQASKLYRMSVISDTAAKALGLRSFYIPDTEGNPSEESDRLDNFLCGKCGALLLKNVTNTYSALFNLICGRCMCQNQVCKTLEYSGTPAFFKDIPELIKNNISPIPNIHFDDFSTRRFDGSIPPKLPEDVIASSESLRSDWIKEHQDLPGVLYQYTSYLGLTGILSNHSVWMTDITYLNDTSEMKLGLDLLEKCINEKMSSVSKACHRVLGAASMAISSTASILTGGYLIACFCMNNDLLSQWRAYGNNGTGYNVGFDSAKLANTPQMHVRKVIYDPSKQTYFIKNAVDKICELFEITRANGTMSPLDDRDLAVLFTDLLLKNIHEFLITFKHKAFAEENEWRVIFPYNFRDDLEKLKFRQYNGMPVPYMELGLDRMDKSIPLLPIVKVTHGPVLHPQLTKKSLSLMMQKYGYAYAEIEGSETPLRL